MSVLILDFGMNDRAGHHVGVARAFAGTLDLAPSKVTVLTNRSVQMATLAGMRVMPVFSATGYEFFDLAPGTLRPRAVARVVERLVFDLLHLEPMLREADRIHVLNANALILRVIAEWLATRARPLAARLELHVMFNLGLTLKAYGPLWRAVEISPYWRQTALDAHDMIMARAPSLSYVAASRLRRLELRRLFGVSARLWANPGLARNGPDWRRGLHAPYVCFGLGDAKLEKGCALLPDLIEGCLARHPHICLAVQMQGNAKAHATIYQRLHDLAAAHTRFSFCDGHLPDADYADLLEGAALLVLPYRQEAYFARASSVLEEAILAGIPCVVPAHTELWDVLRRSEVTGFSFRHNTVGSILEAVDTGIRSVIAPLSR
ncbi:MAG: hypothetical protein CMH66_01590 [Nioella sp.]|nr:hypothetical protein [Nioella sp.]|tara:strand:+ start:483 stop:1613 length:1131 start_codon:yes stop_codon:yes gene_type:complete